MPYIPPEVMARAREMDLLTFLRTYETRELVHFGAALPHSRTRQPGNLQWQMVLVFPWDRRLFCAELSH